MNKSMNFSIRSYFFFCLIKSIYKTIYSQLFLPVHSLNLTTIPCQPTLPKEIPKKGCGRPEFAASPLGDAGAHAPAVFLHLSSRSDVDKHRRRHLKPGYRHKSTGAHLIRAENLPLAKAERTYAASHRILSRPPRSLSLDTTRAHRSP